MNKKLEKCFSVAQTDYGRVTIYYDHPEQVPDGLTVEKLKEILGEAENVEFPDKEKGIFAKWHGIEDFGDSNYGTEDPVFDMTANKYLPHEYNYSLTNGSPVLWERIKDMGEYDLREIMMAYDQYVIEVLGREDAGGSIPVCLAEFIDCEWEIVKKYSSLYRKPSFGGRRNSHKEEFDKFIDCFGPSGIRANQMYEYGYMYDPAAEMIPLSAANAFDYFIIDAVVWILEPTGERIRACAIRDFTDENADKMYGILKEDYIVMLESEWQMKDWNEDIRIVLENSGRFVTAIDEILSIRDDLKVKSEKY